MIREREKFRTDEMKKSPAVKRDFKGWAMLDSNQRPSACKADALNQLS